MQLLWLTENYPPSGGGMAQSCDRIVYGLREMGVHIHVVHLTNRREAYRREQKEKGSYVAVPLHENEAHTLNLCWNYIKNNDPGIDKIVSFGGYLPIIAGPVFSKWLSRPLITLLRGNDFDVSIFAPRRRKMLFECLENSEAVGCISREMMEKIRAIHKGLKLFYTPNGIRLDDWKLIKSDHQFIEEWRNKYAVNRLVVGMFGHLKAKKGLDLLIDAIGSSGKLKNEVMLLLAGEVEDYLVDQLNESEILNHRLPFQDRYQLLRYFGVCDAVCIPSYYDGMPNVLLEAGALGIPVIGSDTGGIRDVLFPQLRSLMFKAGDREELKRILIEFLGKTGEERHEMGDRLREVVETLFNHEKEMEILSNLISASYETKFIV